jgi:PAS domain S-box-containing protein
VPAIADWCAVHVLNEKDEIELVALTHIDPEKLAWALELYHRAGQIPRDGAGGVAEVIRTGEPLAYFEIPPELLADVGPDAREILEIIGMRSFICVPMALRDRVVGAVTLVTAQSGRQYDQHDLDLAEHMARRAAMAIENARILRDVEGERARLESMVSAIDYGICQLDPAGRVVHANPAALRTLEASADRVIGRLFHEIAHVGCCDPECRLEHTIATTEPVVTNDVLVLASGARIDVELIASPARAAERSAGMVIVFHDIGERLRIERSKDDFLAFASHELRTPLTPIIGLTKWLARRAKEQADRFDEDEQGVIATLVSEATRMMRVVEVFLDLSRIDADQFSLDYQPADVADVLRDEAELIRVRHPDARIEVDLPAGAVRAITDGPRLRQVATNLLENAFRYGGQPAEVRLAARAEEGILVVSVSDNGAGISEEDRAHIFERFYRGARASGTKGLGVGLHIVERIVCLAGGSIEVVSEPGAGTTFTVRWPLTLPTSIAEEELAEA